MLKLYAQAAIYKPKSPEAKAAYKTAFMPVLPKQTLTKTVNVCSKHCASYNSLTQWDKVKEIVSSSPKQSVMNTCTDYIHPNYIQTLSLPMQLSMMVSQPFPFKPIGLVHVANQIEVSQLPTQNLDLTITTRFGNIYYHRRGWLFELITEANVIDEPKLPNNSSTSNISTSNISTSNTSTKNAPSLIATSYYLARQRHSTLDAQQYKDASEKIPEWIDKASEDCMFSDTEVLDTQTLVFPEDIGRKYAKISGDYNPIHLYPYTAKFLGFKKAIAHGMYSKALVISKVAAVYPFIEKGFSIKTAFVQPIMLPLSTKLAFTTSNADNSVFCLQSSKGKKTRLHLSGHVKQLT